ncbi:hypothetical protein HAX54_005143, partial [Datura stramonium]|nr:hypothetical protein [Datura stramonium]
VLKCESLPKIKRSQGCYKKKGKSAVHLQNAGTTHGMQVWRRLKLVNLEVEG